MSGDSRARSREMATGTNSERTVPASTSSSVEDSSLGTVMDSLNSVNPMKTLDQVDCSDLLVSGVSNQQRQKKSSFQIIKVITKNKDDVETADDLDETNTEDVSSGILDLSKMTDADQEPSSADTLHSPGGEEFWPSPASLGKHPLSSSEPKEKVVDTHSRFKIVKIESKDRAKKGRWTCMDFADPEHTEKTDEHGTGSNSTSNSIYYIPGATDDQSKSPFAAAIVYNQGHPVLEPNLLKSPLYVNDTRFQQLPFFQNPHLGAIQQPISISDQDALSRCREQQLPTPGKMPVISVPAGSLPSGSLPSNSLPTGTMPVGSLPSGTLPTGSIASGSKPVNTLATGTLHTGTVPASTLPASTLMSGTLHSGSMSSVPVPSGSLPGSVGVTTQAMPFAHGGLLPVNESVGIAQGTVSKSISQLYASDAGANSAGVRDDQSHLAEGRPLSSDSDRRVLAAMPGSGKDPDQTLSSKRTSQTSPLLAMVSATINSSGFASADVDEGYVTYAVIT